jgi:Type IV secretion system pilin
MIKNIFIFAFIIFAFTSIFASSIEVKAADEGLTLNSFNPLGKGGIRCIYAYKSAGKPITLSDGTVCTETNSLLNRVEQLLYILAPSFAVIGIMLGGYQVMQDGYEAKGEGMKKIKGSVVGLIIVLTAFFVRNIVYTFFNGTFNETSITIENKTVDVVIKLIKDICYNILIPIGSPIAVGYVIWGGYLLITAGGVPKKVDQGTKTIKYAIVGFLVIIFAAAIISIAQNLLAGFFKTV